MTLPAAAMNMDFLGEEFLTWLWWKYRRAGGDFVLPDTGRVALFFDDYLSLVREMEEREVHTIRKGSPAYGAEAMTAFLQGKKVAAAKLVIAHETDEWEVTIVGETLAMRSIKLPKSEAGHPEDRLVDRLESLEELCGIVDGLFALYLEERLADDWSDEVVPAMRQTFRDRVQEMAGAE